ncbi:hypothetical protein [Neisseria musculi]|uniref:Uncharacterized protein n=1 Tax=Neisseria musculi TaxID=1815583 RepID=A0A7H1MCF7_9NEIS|nr:hypothetical protein [Neisseria musculi]QNT59322.1 hypothetical protein H7A79_1401 [Neisseria musculi]
MRKIMLSWIALSLPLSVYAANDIDAQLLAMAGQFETGKAEQRIKSITYDIVEQSNAQAGVNISRQTDKFSSVRLFSSHHANVKRKTSRIQGRPDAKSLILLNHWELKWAMGEEGFVMENIQINPAPAQWSANGGTFQSSAILVDRNGQIDLKEQCRLGLSEDAVVIHSKLKGTMQRVNCTLTMNNQTGTMKLTQGFEGYYLPGYQIFIPHILLITNNKTGRVDRLDYQIQKIR